MNVCPTLSVYVPPPADMSRISLLSQIRPIEQCAGCSNGKPTRTCAPLLGTPASKPIDLRYSAQYCRVGAAGICTASREPSAEWSGEEVSLRLPVRRL